MNDYISRAAALTALGERPLVWTDRDEYALGARNQYDQDVLAIQTVPANDSNALECDGMRWIPCAERLPDITEHYVSDPCIVYCSNGAYGFAELEENVFGQVGWNCERDDEYHEPLGEVVAWMPLPEPWKGEV